MSDSIQGGAETIKLIQETAVKAAGIHVEKLPDRRTFLIGTADGAVQRGEVARPLIRDQVFSLEAVVAAYTEGAADGGEGGQPICWHCGPPSVPRIVSIADENEFREISLSMPLRLSATYQQLVAMQAQPADLSHRDLVRLLSHDWRDAVARDTATVFRSVNFETLKRFQSEKGPQLDSLDVSVHSRVSGDVKFPEELSVTLCIYDHVELESLLVKVRVGVEIDVARSRFLLQVMPGEMAKAIDRTHQMLGEQLRAILPEGTIIFHGEPSLP